MRIKFLIASAAGVICGLLSAKVLMIGWWNLIFWGLVGVAVGFFTKGKKEVVWSGILYGLFLSISFLLSGFQGAADKLPVFILFSLGLSIIGAVGGWFSVFIGSKLKK